MGAHCAMATRTCFESAADCPSFIIIQRYYPESRFTWLGRSRRPTAVLTNTARDLKKEGSAAAAADSLVVMARRIAASVALSSKRTLAPSDWTPSCVHRLSKSTLTGLSFIAAYKD